MWSERSPQIRRPALSTRRPSWTLVHKLTELVGISDESYSEATKNAIARTETLRGLGWFEVTELRGLIQTGNFRISGDPESGFRLDEGKDAFSDRE